MKKVKDTSELNWSEYFYYDESSPTYLRNKISKLGVKMHSVAGTLNKQSGYAFIKLDGVVYSAHRIIWEIFNNPLKSSEMIDHINGIRNDNRISNLRVVDDSTNRKNVGLSSRNKSGVCGVRYREDKKSWVGFVKNLSGKDVQKSFKITKYGYLTAKIYAVLWRETQISKLNLQGAGYTDRHGERIK